MLRVAQGTGLRGRPDPDSSLLTRKSGAQWAPSPIHAGCSGPLSLMTRAIYVAPEDLPGSDKTGSTVRVSTTGKFREKSVSGLSADLRVWASCCRVGGVVHSGVIRSAQDQGSGPRAHRTCHGSLPEGPSGQGRYYAGMARPLFRIIAPSNEPQHPWPVMLDK